MSGGGGETTLEHTPTWVVALVCTVIVAISLLLERILHYTGKYLKKKNQKPLYEALLKIKEELMLLGFISLLLAVLQNQINKICIPKHLAHQWLPCKKEYSSSSSEPKTTSHFQSSSGSSSSSTTTSFFSSFLSAGRRHLLAEASSSGGDHCTRLDKVPLLSNTALHHLHIFIFVLAVVHVSFCVLTIVFGGAKIRQLKRWEDSILEKEYNAKEAVENKFTHVQERAFIWGRFLGMGKNSALFGWVRSFFKQFYGSVNRSDYTTLRLGFVMTHCRGNPKFNFHKYMIRALEADFKKVVGISWYLWLIAIVLLLLNVYAWHAYFWISFVTFTLLLAVGAKLQHVITQLAHEVAERHAAVDGDSAVKPSDDLFWFHRPQLVLLLIHVILFQNSFEIALFFWIWVQYGFTSCIMGQVGFVIPRIVVGVLVQFLCSYGTLPIYAIVTQMGSSYKKTIFQEHIQEGLVDWAQKARSNKKGLRKAANRPTQVVDPKESSSATTLELANVGDKESAMEEGNGGGIEAASVSEGHK